MKPIRKIKNKTHKCFGVHSYVVNGNKVISPEAYKKHRGCDFRSRSEKKNADDRKLEKLD